MTLGQRGNPVLTYGTQPGIELTRCSDPACSGQRTFPIGWPNLDGNTAVTVNDADQPIVSIRTGSDLRIAHCDSSSCASSAIRMVEGSVFQARDAAIDVDNDGRPVVVYHDAGWLRVLHCGADICFDSSDLEILPLAGSYYIQNAVNGRFVDADANGQLGTSAIAREDDQWNYAPLGGSPQLTNQLFPTVLDGARTSVEPANDGTFYIEVRGIADDGYLNAGSNTIGFANLNFADRWRFIPVDPLPPSEFVGTSISLRSVANDQWLDTDADGSVNLSQIARADDIWQVEDAGNGRVFLINAVTGRYLDGDQLGESVDTSNNPRSDDQWNLVAGEDGVYALQHVSTGGFVQNVSDVLLAVNQSLYTEWAIVPAVP